MSKGSIFAPLLFILYINDLKKASNTLDPISLAGQTNLFVSEKTVNTVFTNTSLELQKMNEWFQANKLLLNTKKIK